MSEKRSLLPHITNFTKSGTFTVLVKGQARRVLTRPRILLAAVGVIFLVSWMGILRHGALDVALPMLGVRKEFARDHGKSTF